MRVSSPLILSANTRRRSGEKFEVPLLPLPDKIPIQAIQAMPQPNMDPRRGLREIASRIRIREARASIFSAVCGLANEMH
jgi:hypothetical protein